MYPIDVDYGDLLRISGGAISFPTISGTMANIPNETKFEQCLGHKDIPIPLQNVVERTRLMFGQDAGLTI